MKVQGSKVLAGLLAVSFLAGAAQLDVLTPYVAHALEEEITIGSADVNGDGTVNAMDQQAVLDAVGSSVNAVEAGDVDATLNPYGDSWVDVRDVMVVSHAAKKETLTVPEEESSGQTADLKLSKVTGYAGEQATVDLSFLDWNQDIDAYECKLDLDAELKIVGVKCTGDAQYVISGNQIKIYGMYTMQQANRGLLASVTFEMPANARGDYGVSILDASAYNSKLQSISLSKTTGGVTVDNVTRPLYLAASEVNAKSLKLSWTMPFDTDQIDGYIICRDGEEIARTEALFYDDTDLTTGETYTYTVQAYGEDYLSGVSKAAKATPQAPEIKAITFPDNADTVGGKYAFVGCELSHTINAAEYSLSCIAPDKTRTVIYEGTNQSFSTLNLKWQLSDLASGKYEVELNVKDVDGATASKTVEVTVDTDPPKEVANFTIFEGEECNKLTWSISEEAKVVGYNLYRRTATSNYNLLTYLDGRDTLEYTDADVVVGEAYSYVIAAVDRYGQEGVFSKEISAASKPDETAPEITLFLPAAGTTLHSVITLNVRAADNIGVSKIACFLSEDDGETWKLLFTGAGANASYKFDTSAHTEASVKIKAIAYDYAGNESSGANVNVYAIDNQGPEKVTGLAVSVSYATMATVAWSDVADNDFSYFIVEYGQTGSTIKKTEHVNRTLGINLSGLLPDTSYDLTVKACDIYGNVGETSDVLTFTTQSDTTAPVVRRILPEPSYFSKSIPLEVTISDDFAVASVTIEASADQKTWTPVATIANESASTSFTAKAELNLTDYADGSAFVRVYGADTAGNVGEAESAPVYEYAVDHTAPVAVTDIKVGEQVNYIELIWAGNDADMISCYRVYRADSADGSFVLLDGAVKSLNFADRMVETDHEYYYKVSAVDVAGNESELSEAVSASLAKDDTAPEICSISPASGTQMSRNQRTVSVLASDNLLLSSVKLEYKTDPDAETYTLLTEKSSIASYYTTVEASLPVALLSDGAKIYLRAQATDQNGNVSEYKEAVYTVNDAVTTISSVTVEQSESANTVKWVATESELTLGYYVYRKIGSGSYTCIGSLPKSDIQNGEYTFEDSDLSKDGTYVYKIQSLNENGNTATRISGTVSVHTKPSMALTCESAMEEDVEYIFDATDCSDYSGIRSVLISYGDGTSDLADSAAAAKFVHTYQKTGTYTVTLTAQNEYGLTNTLKRSVVVTERAMMGSVTVKVRTTEGKTASGIAVYADFGTDAQKKMITNQNGELTFVTSVGSHTIGVYGDGYLPQVKDCIVVTGANTVLEFSVVEEFIVSAEFEIKRMTLDDIIAAGIDVSQPQNQHVVQVQIDLTYQVTGIENQQQKVSAYVNPTTHRVVAYHAPSGGSGYGGYQYTPVYVDVDEETGEIGTVVLMSVPVKTSYLKEFFNVQLHIMNNADKEFNISDSTVSLNVPDGLTLMENALECDPRTVTIDNIPGQTQKTVSWILRGDKAGEYYLNADFMGNLDVFKEKITTNFVSETPVKVYGETSLSVDINMCRTIQRNRTFFEVTMKNNTDVPVYNVGSSVGTILTQVYDVQNAVEASVYQTRIVHPDGTMEVIDDTESLTELRPGYALSVVYVARNLFPNSVNPVTGKPVSLGNCILTLMQSSIKLLNDSNIPARLHLVDGINLISTGENDGESKSPIVQVDDNVDLKKQYVLAVYNLLYTPIVGAKVTLTDASGKTYSAVTNGKGQAVLDRPADEGSVSLSITADDYESYDESGYLLRYSGYDHAYLCGKTDDSYRLRVAKYHPLVGIGTNVLTGAKRLNMGNTGDFSFTCEAFAKTVSKYELWQGSQLIDTDYAPEDGNKGEFSLLQTKKFEEGKDVFIRAYMPNGASVDTPINFEILEDPNTSDWGFSIDGGEISFTVSDDIPYLGGSTVTIALPDIAGDQLCFELEENHIKLGINYEIPQGDDEDDAEDAWKEFKNNLNRNLDDILDDTMKECKGWDLGAAEVSVNLAGYAEGELGDDGNATITGCIYVEVSAECEFNFQTVVYAIPLTAQIAIGLSCTPTATFTFDYDAIEQVWSYEGTLTAEIGASLEAFGGVGISGVVAAGVYGKAELDLSMLLLSSKELEPPSVNSIDLTGELGIKAYLGPFEYEKSWLSRTWNLYTNKRLLNAAAGFMDIVDPEKASAQGYLRALYDASNYTVDEESEVTPLAWNAQASVQDGSMQTLLEDAYDGAKPVMVSSATDTILAFLAKDPTRSAYDAPRVMFSRYDAETGTWSAPIAADENGTGDYAPQLCTDGTDIYLVYQEANQVFGADAALTPEAFAPTLGITAAKFDSETGTFTGHTAMAVPENSYNSQPAITVADGVATAVWVSNTDPDFFGCNRTNQILTSTLTDGVWSEPTVNVKNISSVTGLAIGKMGEQTGVAYITDGDNNLTTMSDRTLYQFNLGTTAHSVAKGALSHPQFAQMPDTDTASLIWYQAGNIGCTVDGKTVTQLFAKQVTGLTDTFAICGNRVVYAGADHESSNLNMIVYDKTAAAWGEPIQVTRQDQYLEDLSFVETDGNLLTVMMQREVTIGEDSVGITSKLTTMQIPTVHNLSVGVPDFAPEDVKAGASLPLSIPVKNNGETAISAVDVTIYDASGAKICAATQEVSIASGATVAVEVSCPLPTSMENPDFTIVVNAPGMEDTNLADNQTLLALGCTNLTLSAESILLGNTQQLLLTVTNDSAIASGGVLSIFRRSDMETPVYTELFESIAAGQSKLILVNVDASLADESGFVICQVAADQDEYYNVDNTAVLAVSAVENAGDVSGDGIVDSTDAVMVLKAYAQILRDGKSDLTSSQAALADVNADGAIDSTDATIILKFYAKSMVDASLTFADYLKTLAQ